MAVAIKGGGRERRAIKALKKQAKKPPANIDDCIALGDQLAVAREWKSAINCFQAALNKEERNARVLGKLAYVCACAGLLNKALNCYELALTIQPENSELPKNIGAIYLATGDPRRALEFLGRVSELNNHDSDCQYMLAEAYSQLNDVEKSKGYYQRAILLFNKQKLQAPGLIKFGRALAALKQYTAAVGALREAVDSSPNLAGGHFELAVVYDTAGDQPRAAAAYRRVLELVPGHASALNGYAKMMAGQGLLHKSAWAYRRLTKLFPDNAGARHFLAAMSQENVTGVTEEVYVRDVFDDYADSFEEHLVNGLSYATPQHFEALYRPYWAGQLLKIIDLGCGTGLCGPLFKEMASYMIGVDLSQGMLEQAEKKGVYDELQLIELVSALECEYQSQDLLIAADVLIYVGDIAPVLKAGKQALRTGGKFLFSVESLTGSSYRLGVSGRYQHSDAYIKLLAKTEGFQIIHQENSILRTESGQGVAGILYLLEK